jgi:sugar diacid utilization regulator
VDEHIAELIVHRDHHLLQALRAQALAPMREVDDNARERLEATLWYWLAHMGNRAAVAKELHIHPQTVSYRVAQLRTLFGDQLDDPRRRAQLFLALAWKPTRHSVTQTRHTQSGAE